mgnify:CR=1 FL=1
MTIAERMKMYEFNTKQISNIPPYLPFVIRLDGKSFSKYTSNLIKPVDELFRRSMNDCLLEFQAKTGYTHSDEITLVFSPMCSKDEFLKNNKLSHIYRGM